MKHLLGSPARRLPAWLVVLVTSAAFVSQTQAVTLINPSFEDISGESQSNEFTFGPLNGWDLYDPGNITDGGDGPTYYIGTLTPNPPTNFINGATDGQRVGIAFNFFGSGGQGEYGFRKILTETLAPDTDYMLSVDIGNIASGTAQSGQFFNLDGFPGYRIDVLADGVLIGQDNNSLAGTIPEGEFVTSFLEFNTGETLANEYEIRLVNLNIVDPLFPNADLEVDFDNVVLDTFFTIPCCYDLNGDGFVGIDDLNIVLSNWNQNVPPADARADPSGDGFVGIDDLNEVLSHWNAGTPPIGQASIPEPGTLMLVTCVGGLGLVRRRTRH